MSRLGRELDGGYSFRLLLLFTESSVGRIAGKLSKKAMTALHDRVARATAAQRAADDEPEEEEGEDDEEIGDEDGDKDGSGDNGNDGGGGGGADANEDAEGSSGVRTRAERELAHTCV